MPPLSRFRSLFVVVAASLCGNAVLANETLYGRLNVSLDYVRAHGPGGDEPSLRRVSSNSSRIGFRGAESLGRGLVAIWQIESSIGADAGGGVLANRETFIGLDGDWGTLKAGHFLSPYDDMHAVFGNVTTLTTSILSTAGIWAQGSLSKVAGGFDARLANSIRYDTPEFNGLEGSVQVALGEDIPRSHVLSLGAVYNSGAFEAGVAWERNRRIRGEGVDDWGVTATAAYNFGPLRVAGVYERLRYDTPIGTLSRNFWGASATYVDGPRSLYLFWGHALDGRAPADVRVGGLTRGAGSGADQYEITFTYTLSPRTLAYIGYVRLANEARASYNFSTNPYTAGSPTGLRLNGYIAGAAHFF
ncbi:MAG TPA: porin [Casimicrobiaceae bacterium]|nr:porin [Casimicrobiaceae bacterium]